MGSSLNLLYEAHECYKKHIRGGLKKYGLKARQPKIMYYILEHEGCQQKDIAKNCYVETATLSTVLKNMEKQDLIERRSLSTDKRAYSIFPKEEAREVFEAVKQQFVNTLNTALSGFSNEEREQFLGYLKRVENNLRNDIEIHETISREYA